MSGVIKVNHQELKELLKNIIEKRLSLFIIGSFGIGKSFVVRETAMEIAQEKGLKFSDDIEDVNKEDVFMLIDQRISQFDPSDFRIPYPNPDTKLCNWYYSDWLPVKGQGILFLDEFNQANELVQSACFQLILDRRIGTRKIPDGYAIIAAGNRIDDNPNVVELAAPLKNRFLWVELVIPTVKEWVDNFALKYGVDERIIAFLMSREDCLYRWSAENEDNAIPTPRSWEFASRLIKDVEDLDKIFLYTAMAVGEGTAIEFKGFLKLQKKIDLNEILASPNKFDMIEDTSLKWATVSSIVTTFRKVMERYKTSDVKEFVKKVKNSPQDTALMDGIYNFLIKV